MIPVYATLALLTLGAASVQPPQVPAHGRQEAVITLDRAQMVRLSAEGSAGTACELVDHQRGPFEHSGRVGKENCRLELLLDAGSYKLRLDSPAKGKGQVKLKVEPFAEVNQPLVRLEPRRLQEQTLHPGQQASYWLHLDQRQPVILQAWGRTVGQVELWRNGEWREEVGLRHELVPLKEGQRLHHWSTESTLEAGNYLLTVYGAPRTWTWSPLATATTRHPRSGRLPSPWAPWGEPAWSFPGGGWWWRRSALQRQATSRCS
jgi:hypothetical protein